MEQQNLPRTTLALSLFACVAIADTPKGGGPVVRPMAAESAYTDPLGRSETIVLGKFGELGGQQNSAGFQTTVENDAAGNPTLTLLPTGASYERVFDNRGNLLSRLDQNLDSLTTYTYEDQFSRLIGITDVFGELTELEYDAAGNAVGLVTPMGRELSAEFDPRGLMMTMTNTEDESLTLEYNEDGNLASASWQNGIHSNSTAIEYTPEGYVQTVQDPGGRLTSLDYDAMGRITKVTLPDGREIAYAYDAGGYLESIVPPGRSAHEFEFDSEGMPTVHRYPAVPNGGTNEVVYEYNLASQISKTTRPDSIEITYDYDDAGKLSSIVTPGGSYTYSYDDSTGLPQTVVSPSGIQKTNTFQANLLTEERWTGAIAGYLGYTLDQAGRLATIDVSGTPITYAYDSDSQLATVGDLGIHYDPTSGARTGTSLEVITEEFEYDGAGQLIRHAVSNETDMLYEATYVRDELGYIASIEETIEGVVSAYSYTYDDAGRLSTFAEGASTPTVYAYDSNNNIVGMGESYDAQDRLTSTPGATYDYNAAGELVQQTEGAQVTGYQYDAFGNLVGVTLPNGDQVAYQLDGENRRVVRTLNGVRTDGWLYAGSLKPVARLDENDALSEIYVYADRGSVPAYIIAGSQRYKVVANHVGSVRLVVDVDDGTIVQRIDYTPWGAVLSDSNPGFQPFGFTGGMLDPGSGLTHLGHREYDANTARWTRKDPAGLLSSVNHYEYAASNPVNYSDPTGLVTARGLIAGAVDASAQFTTYLGAIAEKAGFDKGFQTKLGVVGAGVGFVDLAIKTYRNGWPSTGQEGAELFANGGGWGLGVVSAVGESLPAWAGTAAGTIAGTGAAAVGIASATAATFPTVQETWQNDFWSESHPTEAFSTEALQRLRDAYRDRDPSRYGPLNARTGRGCVGEYLNPVSAIEISIF